MKWQLSSKNLKFVVRDYFSSSLKSVNPNSQNVSLGFLNIIKWVGQKILSIYKTNIEILSQISFSLHLLPIKKKRKWAKRLNNEKPSFQQKTCSWPFVRYFRTLFWDDIKIICCWKLSKQISQLSKKVFFSQLKNLTRFSSQIIVISSQNNVWTSPMKGHEQVYS